ncbi:hypothetical protein KvSKV_05765 [Ketogulonicigenium vulgare]|uniref:Uncharacterized protein n=1 Tax=Ketogulonicigenium vulgare (strain WSH-001) TaxID=759362 RepID=F9Y4J6_KETVW|nr:hypothetical protein KVU_0714 [Ketogulonicigenium vulgare WSH-001]ALJ80738.1 hypothetical protein KVH_05795 [Ketogulonicigenium vulgare]ANW34964.1 hypothetical protein KvSKV_05765 [Ketogulonicigenium vulgare]
MEQFVTEVEAYAKAVGRPPQSILKSAVRASWRVWQAWLDGKSSPTMAVADRVRAYMAANPPAAQNERAA